MTYYYYHDWTNGNSALFTSLKDALIFKNKEERALLELTGDTLDADDISITEVKLNPDFNEWFYGNGKG